MYCLLLLMLEYDEKRNSQSKINTMIDTFIAVFLFSTLAPNTF